MIPDRRSTSGPSTSGPPEKAVSTPLKAPERVTLWLGDDGKVDLMPVGEPVEYVPAHHTVPRELAAELAEALEDARAALMDARNGLDLGLGCARDLEGDEKAVPTAERSLWQYLHLERAREAHRRAARAQSSGLLEPEETR